MPCSICSIAFALFLLMDSFGNIPIYLSILKDIPKKKRLQIIIREMLISLFLIILFALFGNAFLNFLGISQTSMKLSGGIVLFILGLKMIFPNKDSSGFHVDGEPFIFPLAVPLVAGPAVLAAVMIYAHQAKVTIYILLSAIVLAWGATATVLLLAGFLAKWMSKKGLAALERMMGLILIMIAIEMFLKGWDAVS